MPFILDVEGDVPNHAGLRRRNNIDGAKIGSLFSQKRRHAGEDAGFVREFQPDGEAVIGIGADINHSCIPLFVSPV